MTWSSGVGSASPRGPPIWSVTGTRAALPTFDDVARRADPAAEWKPLRAARRRREDGRGCSDVSDGLLEAAAAADARGGGRPLDRADRDRERPPPCQDGLVLVPGDGAVALHRACTQVGKRLVLG